MNLKTFAQQARTILMGGVAKKISYWGFDAQGHLTEEPKWVEGGYFFRGEPYDNAGAKPRYQKLREAIRKRGVREVTEEAAYTWFNRMVALKILSANGYELPTLDYADGNQHLPQLLQRARRGEYTTYLTANEQGRIQRVLHDYAMDTAAFGILLTGYCHAHPLIQRVFGGIDDYTELLLPDDILDANGFLHLLNTTDALTEADYQRVELIGWLYQFYVADRKDEVVGFSKSGKKVETKDIPAATQIFTPNWIVKYMVENTVGKLWLNLHPDSLLKNDLKYLVESADTKYDSPIIKEVSQLKLLDPAAGSGHILVEGFDLLYEMYMEEFYTPEEAVESILQNNLFGLDLDKRAAQLAKFAVLLKAAKKYKDVIKKGWVPHIYSMPESADFSRQEIFDFLGLVGVKYEDELIAVLNLMKEAKNLGSIMKFSISVEAADFFAKRLVELENKPFKSFDEEIIYSKIGPYLRVLFLLLKKYEAVVANPPYMGNKWMNESLAKYIEKNYADSKTDLMTVFIEVCHNLMVDKAYSGIVTLDSWMFLSSFEKLRNLIFTQSNIDSLVHIGWNSFPDGHPYNRGVAFCLCKYSNRAGIYINLSNVPATVDKHTLFLERNFSNDNKHVKSAKEFSKIPGSPVAYWVSNRMIDLFNKPKIQEIGNAKEGIGTRDDERFIRFSWEVSKIKIGKDLKWLLTDKAGSNRKWYSMILHVMNWENNGFEIRNFKDGNGKLKSRPQNISFLYLPAVSWGKVTSGQSSFRYRSQGYGFNDAAPSLFSNKYLFYLCGLLNTKVTEALLSISGNNINYTVGSIQSLPLVFADPIEKIVIEEKVSYCITNTKKDWDSRETSWDFETTPLGEKGANLPEAYQQWQREVTHDFFQLHANEEELNRIFIELYGLQEELTPEVALKDITILQEELDTNALVALESEFRERGAVELPIKREVVMQQLISYAIGCMMGRYRLDKPGLHIAHPDPTEAELAPYEIGGYPVEIDADAILPLMGTAADFPDDVLHRFKTFLDVLWGEETRIANLNFLQECLNQDLEKFLVNGFWKVHCSMYKKKPIYWLFASPKGAFQVLVYMHRMNSFTVEKIRSNYLMEHLRNLRFQIEQLSNQPGTLGRDDAKRLDKLRADLLECETYDLHLKTIADAQISFDLDDGVSVNYEKFKAVVAGIK
ncbi:BREX-1 system adenine-specific DNA-methyltransferase PglX [Runella zeae]|uniref:BREX-1 system adenine-specific DNA-methyltransferase PglX n=1 Tax=Runella zeae TaxID=94255 RepID=UPI0003FA43D0|nr:BREX-1 system adenine-specific DNA-methyltransferase PglX [Runella zeae]